MFDEIYPPYFGQGVLKWPKHQLAVEQIGALIRYDAICMFLHTLGYKADCRLISLHL